MSQKKSKPIDIVLSLIPSLTDREMAKVRKAIQMEELSPCEQKGHSYKQIAIVDPGSFFRVASTTFKLVCSKCGDEKSV